jgi:hypothetical protein
MGSALGQAKMAGMTIWKAHREINPHLKLAPENNPTSTTWQGINIARFPRRLDQMCYIQLGCMSF